MNMKRNFVAIAIILFGCVALPAQEPIVPIVQGSYLVGGTQGGKWLKPARVPLGSSPKFRGIRKYAADRNTLTARTDEKWDACYENRVVQFGDADDSEPRPDDFPGLFIGEAAGWDLIPRQPVDLDKNDSAVSTSVTNFLRTKGIRDSPTRITEAISVDLDGDGLQEEIITGYYYSRWEQQFDLSTGDYSFALLRVVSGRAKKNFLIDGQFLGREIYHDYAEHSIVGVADLNADGRMEIAIKSTHSESDRQMIFEFRNGKAVLLFDESCGG